MGGVLYRVEDTPRRRRGRPARSGPGEQPRAADFWSQPDEAQEEGRLQGLVDRTQEADTEEEGTRGENSVQAAGGLVLEEGPQETEHEASPAPGAAVLDEVVIGEEAAEEDQADFELGALADHLQEAEEDRVEMAGTDEQDRFLLGGRANPELPLPRFVADEEEGWKFIDRLGAEASFLCSFPLLQEIPDQHKSQWANAVGNVLHRWQEASTDEDSTRALLWLGFLPQALQRKPL